MMFKLFLFAALLVQVGINYKFWNFRSYNFNFELQVFAQDELPPSSNEPTPDPPAPEEPEQLSTDDKTRQ
jgi:hypothetical protein